MRNYISAAFLIMLCCAVIISCGDETKDEGKQTAEDQATVSYLPERIDGTSIERTSEPQLFVGESLYEYINGGAEQYHEYGFVEVATAYYKNGESEVIADVYRFDSSEHAYGLYSVLRPDNARLIPLGIEGYVTRSSLECVKGAYMVRLTGYDESKETAEMLSFLGDALEAALPDKTGKPAMFDLFPVDNRAPTSDKIIATGFMSAEFLKDVYTQSYSLDGDTVRLFLAADMENVLFSQWIDALGMNDPRSSQLIERLADSVAAFRLKSQHHGKAIVASKGNWIAGAINYDETHRDFLITWIESLPQ